MERGGLYVDVVMEMPSDTHTHTRAHVCVFVCRHVAGWMDRSRGWEGDIKEGVDGRLMKMKECETVYLGVKQGEDAALHLANNAKYWRILEQI